MRRLLFLLLACCLLPACQRMDDNQLRFATMGRSTIQDLEDLGNIEYREHTPALVIIATPEELPPVLTTYLPNLPEQALRLSELSYERNFAILVIQGHMASIQHEIEVLSVEREGDVVTLHARFESPTGYNSPAFVTPYHLIGLRKVGTWGTPITFRLLDQQGELRAETTHFIP